MQVASSLNSANCYILQDNGSFVTWLGSLSSASDHNILDMMMNKLCVRTTLPANPSLVLTMINIENNNSLVSWAWGIPFRQNLVNPTCCTASKNPYQKSYMWYMQNYSQIQYLCWDSENTSLTVSTL